MVILTGPGDTSAHLCNYFEGASEFTVSTITPPEGENTVKCPNPELSSEHRAEIVYFLRALDYGTPEAGLLFLRSTAQPLLPVSHLAAFLTSLKSHPSCEILYLGRYLDRCDLYTEVGKWEHLRLMSTRNSNGSFALYFSPRGWSKLRSPSYFEPYHAPLGRNLSAHVFDGRFIALTSEPPVFTHRAKHPQDWVKTHACKIPLDGNHPLVYTPPQPLSFWWFLLITLGLVVLALWLWR